jgi:phosphate-selective porin OprO/OprP
MNILRMKHPRAVLAFACLGYACAAPAADIDHWPVTYTFGNGTAFSLTGNYQYDAVNAHGDAAIEDAHTNRRKEFGFTLRQKDKWDAMVYFDFQAKKWLDVYWRMDTRWLFGEDYGKLRFGYTKLPLGFEGMTSARSDSFMELSLPMQAFFQNRRTGVDWTFERQQYLVNVGYYFGQDLQGDSDGSTFAARAAWTPRKAAGDVVHIGLSLSEESPQATTDGFGRHTAASARWRAKAETGLTDAYLVDSGSLARVDSNRRLGLEGLWIRGPFSLQGEYLDERSKREDGLADFSGHGYYAFASYVLTGESRPYTSGNVGNVKPARPWGALELLARYSTVDLDDGAIHGGRAHDLTVGANWYLTQHVKFQANYVRARATRAGVDSDPDIMELRAQVYF